LPPQTFATTLLDLLSPATAAAPKTIVELRASISALPVADAELKRTLLALLDDTQHDLAAFKLRIETWFNNQMERVGGWYKRKVQLITLGMASLLAVFANADSLVIARAFWNDAALRNVVVAEAEKFLQSTQDDKTKPKAKDDVDEKLKTLQKRIQQVQGLGLPIGWPEPPASFADVVKAAKRGLLGWTITALAISLGAPFWFDLLSKVIKIRAAGKVPPPTKDA
jgi:hypothetical protein